MNFLRNTWYACATAAELSDNLLPRTLLGEPIVFYRKRDGTAVALRDRCPHRFVPLHIGKIVDDNVQCGYHGLQFNGSGQCVRSPFDARIAKIAKVQAYPLEERYSMLWIWMGDPALADPGMIPDFGCLVDPRRKQVSGYTRVQANYELVVDNLADLSHASFLHGSFIAQEGLDRATHKVVEEAGSVYSKFWYPEALIPPLFGAYYEDRQAIVDRWSEIRWDAPCSVLLWAGVTPPGRQRSDGIDLFGVHLLAPETEHSTHYFYCHCRGFKLADPATDELVMNWQQVAFHEQDKPMLNAQQRAMGDVTDLMSLKPLLLATDAGAVRIRKSLHKRIQAEAKEATRSEASTTAT
ncbi:aromatic ring-hydroxylating dioxygenase subunit alpha [soil metagenome]